MFKNVFSFNGRIRRMEYGLSLLIYMAVYFAGFTIITSLGLEAVPNLILIVLLFIPLVWFMIAQAAKRCHDRGNSGWWQLIPFYGFWLLFADSEPGANEFGYNPKGIGNVDEIDNIGSYLKD
jgi:uncharacterized membrane protein YhaH (DUF805 family)